MTFSLNRKAELKYEKAVFSMDAYIKSPRSAKRWSAAGIALSLTAIFPGTGHAQSTLTSNMPPTITKPVLSASSSLVNPMQVGNDDGATTGCHYFDRYRTRGSEVPAITTCDDISPEWGGLRQILVDHGILITGVLAGSLTYDMLGHDAHTPHYVGQNLTYNSAPGFTLTFDLNRTHLPFWKDAQFTMTGYLWRNNYPGRGPNAFGMSQFSIVQPFFTPRIAIQYGYTEFANQFYGTNYGTSTAASALGPSSVIPVQVGMSNFFATPSFDVRFFSKSMRFYDHFGVARSVSPLGARAVVQAGMGLEWHVPNTGALFIDEVGYRIRPSVDHHMMWLRGGAIYNNTSYFNYSQNKFTRGNQAFYVAADYQIMQFDRKTPSRGMFMNFKADAAPPDRNVFARDISGTIYFVGPFASRPKDSASLGFTFNKLSNFAYAYRVARGATAAHSSNTTTASYALHVMRGLYFTNSLSYVHNPAPTPKLHDAFLITSGLTLSL